MMPEEEIIHNLRLVADLLFENNQPSEGAIAHNLLVYWKNAETSEEKSDLGHRTMLSFGGRGGIHDSFNSYNISDAEAKRKTFNKATERVYELAFTLLK